MTALLTADRCPDCQYVHGVPTEWPTCPDHGHWMSLSRITDDGFLYRCPARWPRRCTRTRTRKERATMTDTTTAALALHEGQTYWDGRQLAALQQLGIRDVTKADLQMFLHYCQRTGLDPFSRQIYLIARNTKDGVRQTIQVGIDGYRVIAQRAAKRDGVTLNYGPTIWYDDDEGEHKVWVRPGQPAAASVTVYRAGKPFPGVARFDSFAQRNKQGDLIGLWPTMGDHLIAKCAEAQALRKAFPHDLAGIITDEEAGQFGRRNAPAPRTLTVAAVDATPDPEPEPIDAQTLRDAIAGEFTRLGIEDEEERAVYGYQLAGVEHGAELTQEDLDRIVTALADCETIEHIREITGEPK
jgi:phage recombination protein Bet